MSRRQSYTADFKRQVVLFAQTSNNCATPREFGVNETLIRDWMKLWGQLFSVQRAASCFSRPCDREA
ncbi:hypothetical protein HPB49_025548 [Dermacentor silvarum]|uniref:Uncharacterized protein n=1 Tax=Dermacentor silvarum TaxID=543639 RepID=A0ACB8CNR4_DERSI|nr:hypothetical protein HPB49_025548 [Dermacentor silvarum]